MGKDSQGTEASGGSNENYGLDSCEAHHVGFSKTEDRSRSKSAVGEVKGWAEEGGIEPVQSPANRRRDSPNQ
jgi:hypothetical protein